jgi:hypothetical protein
VVEHSREHDQDTGEWAPISRRVPLLLLAVTVALALLSIGLPNIAPNVPFMAAEGSPVRMFFGVSAEMSLPTFFSVGLLVAAASAHALLGRLLDRDKAFAVLAVVLLLLALDDFAALHERLVIISDAVGVESGYGWVLPGLVVAMGVVVAFVRVATRLTRKARRVLLLGVLLFLGAAFGLESVNGLLDRPGTDGAPLQVLTHVEEVLENVGVILVFSAALRVLEIKRSQGGLTIRIVPGLVRGTDEAEGVGRARVPVADDERTTPLPTSVGHRVTAPRG